VCVCVCMRVWVCMLHYCTLDILHNYTHSTFYTTTHTQHSTPLHHYTHSAFYTTTPLHTLHIPFPPLALAIRFTSASSSMLMRSGVTHSLGACTSPCQSVCVCVRMIISKNLRALHYTTNLYTAPQYTTLHDTLYHHTHPRRNELWLAIQHMALYVRP
jgi:hypothetical protein